MNTPLLDPDQRRSRRSSTHSHSPEFEFWKLPNPSFPQSNLLSADQLFANGILLPLHLLPQTSSQPEFSPAASKRWAGIFKKSDNKSFTKNQDTGTKKEKMSGIGASSAQLNINIWPFSRSRSAGNGATRSRMVPGAPGCSRSNSAGESKSRKWPNSPGRVGVHLGRSSPVWQVRRGGKGSETVIRSAENGDNKKDGRERQSRRSKVVSGGGGGGGGGKGRVLNLNVATLIGYRHSFSCKSDENGGVSVSVGGGNVGNGGDVFNLRSLFSKKVY